MKKLNKFFIIALVAGVVVFTAPLVLPTQMAQALIKTEQIENNAITSPKIKDGEVKTPDLATAAVTKPKLDPNAVKLVVVQRTSNQETAQPHLAATQQAACNSNEVVTGGGFQIAGMVIVNSFAIDNEWEVQLFNPTDEPHNYRIFAECAHLELGP